ncbi:type A2 lantipeptide [Streptomyces enissocaesilis]|uniref:Type A2 lantipeptide n=1 Tax=Streptomyces enissocaesilis TaxID=332589 RepID=A0ABN3X9N9_9ACTN
MNFSQVATQEISDNDLDNVSGGLLGTPVLANATGLVDSVFPVSATVGSAVGTVEGVTGLNTAPATGIATATIAGV